MPFAVENDTKLFVLSLSGALSCCKFKKIGIVDLLLHKMESANATTGTSIFYSEIPHSSLNRFLSIHDQLSLRYFLSLEAYLQLSEYICSSPFFIAQILYNNLNNSKQGIIRYKIYFKHLSWILSSLCFLSKISQFKLRTRGPQVRLLSLQF